MLRLQRLQKGFTLIEMLVIAPIVILAIGAFIATIVNLTGEVMSSRGANILVYNTQDALNRIENDVKLSAGFLATNSIKFKPISDPNPNPQGRGAVNSTTDFTITDPGQALILNAYVTDGNPISLSSGLIYLKGLPNDCSSYALYSKNRPMTMNIIYFVDSNGTLWRRTVMPQNYTDTNIYCGAKAPWQQPSCIDDPSRSTFCKTNDEKLLENVGTTGFSVNYFTAANSNTPMTISGATTTADLQSATTLGVTLSSSSTIAGREVAKTGTLRVSRLDTNASAVGDLRAPTTVPNAPSVASTVFDGHKVNFTWPQVPTATGYDINYRINGGAWQTGASNLSATNRSYTVTSGGHTDVVEAQVRAKNTVGDSAYGTNATTIPLWAPMVLENNWNTYDTTYAPPSYTKTKAGVVLLRGLIKGGSGVIATLPEDYRPDMYIMFENLSSGVVGRIDIRNNGTIFMSVGNNTWYSLDSINYMSSESVHTPLSFANGWVNYSPSSGDPSWAPGSYFVDTEGRVHTRGLVRAGTTTDNVVIGTFPNSLAPAGYMHVANDAANGHGLIGINNGTGAVLAKGYSNTYLSLNSMFYPASSRASGSTCTTQWCTLTMQNSWVHYGGNYTTPQYTKGSDNLVIVKGLIRAGTVGANIATLPQGFCPSKRLLMSAANSGGWGRIDIVPGATPAAGCTIFGSTVNSGWTSLDTLIFYAEQ